MRETRAIWKTRPIALGLTALAGSLLLVAAALMIGGTYFGIWFANRFDATSTLPAAWRYLRWGVAIGSAVLAIQLIYHFGPNLKQRFRDSLAGAMIAVMSCVGLSYLLNGYSRHFENLNRTYGALGGAIGLYVCFYLSGFAILAGGEINFLLGELKARKSPESSKTLVARIKNLSAAARAA